ncbi:MAG: hypothetical protein WC262_13225 [Bacteroidales bacterium]|jgi:hypothetical protein
MSTLAETTLVMKRLSSAYGQQVDVERARAYHQVLGHNPRMVLAEAATIALTRGSQFLPKPVELINIIQRNSLVARWAGADRYDERAWWLAYAKGYTDSDEFSQADIDTIYSGMRGYTSYQDGKQVSTNADKFIKYYRQQVTQ